MPKQPLTWWDLVLYSWTSVFILCIVVGFPPFAFVWLLFPLWHRKRRRFQARVRKIRQDAYYDQWARDTF